MKNVPPRHFGKPKVREMLVMMELMISEVLNLWSQFYKRM